MKEIFIKLLRFKLRYLARFTIARYEPRIIGITGSVGKTSMKNALKAVLAKNYRVRASLGNLNNELGLSLAILGDWRTEDLALVSHGTPAGTAKIRKIFFWFRVIAGSAWRIVKKTEQYPEILILEYGADRPGDIKNLLKIARPEMTIITAVGDIPAHVEFFAGPDDVAREKGRLIECLPAAGLAILNGDDDAVARLKSRTRARVMTFGFLKETDMRITRFENSVEDDIPVGVSFKFEYQGAVVPVHIKGVFGKAQAYAAAAAAVIGLAFGMNLVAISEALGNYVPAPSRMRLLAGIKGTFIIDDCYNASPLSMHAALDTLRDLPAKRKVAVLGDMLEIGKYTVEAHERVGDLAGKFLDVLVTVGARAKFIAAAAKSAGMKSANILSFDTADDAKKSVQDLMRKGDLVLVKGSHSMELDKVVEKVRYVQYVIS
jgi:UDP-N-acetylmuramoyl-tripeptide--D-alanyl-D-alanine ligase